MSGYGRVGKSGNQRMYQRQSRIWLHSYYIYATLEYVKRKMSYGKIVSITHMPWNSYSLYEILIKFVMIEPDES
jgi:trehalose-6-phosphate synthase